MDTLTILSYFPFLTDKQRERFNALGPLYTEWNEKINVVSRKDIGNLYERHILHSLAIGAFLGEVPDGMRFVDIGTGGGFPAIPLAILYPNATFHLVDRIAKKLRVAEAIAASIGLENITLQHGDMSECHERFDFAVSRAVMRLDLLVKIAARNIVPGHKARYQNGLICLKGGDIAEESQGVRYPVMEYPIREFFNEDFFDTKSIVYVPM